MKRFCLTITVLLSFMTIQAQLSTLIERNLTEAAPAKYECLYEYTISRINANGDSVKDNAFTILQIGNTQSKFEDYSAFQYDSVRHTKASMEEISRFAAQYCGAENYFDAEIFQNVTEKKLTQMECIGVTYYTCEENFPTVEWTLSDDTLTVCGYLCNKATGEYGGRKWIAWYTAELPMSNGPWKLSGLPGLILQAADTEGIHQFSAFSFRKGDPPIWKINTVHVQNVERDVLLQYKAKMTSFSNPLDGLGSGNINKIVGLNIKQGGKNSYVVNDIIQRNHPNGYIPLELK